MNTSFFISTVIWFISESANVHGVDSTHTHTRAQTNTSPDRYSFLSAFNGVILSQVRPQECVRHHTGICSVPTVRASSAERRQGPPDNTALRRTRTDQCSRPFVILISIKWFKGRAARRLATFLKETTPRLCRVPLVVATSALSTLTEPPHVYPLQMEPNFNRSGMFFLAKKCLAREFHDS